MALGLSCMIGASILGLWMTVGGTKRSFLSMPWTGGSEVHRWKVKRVGGSVWHSNQLFPDLSSTANDGATRLSHVSVKPHVTSAVCFKMRFFLLHQLAIFCQDFGTLAHRFTSYRTTSQKLPGNSLDEIFQSIHMFLVHNHSEVINCMAESLNFAPAVAVHFV